MSDFAKRQAWFGLVGAFLFGALIAWLKATEDLPCTPMERVWMRSIVWAKKGQDCEAWDCAPRWRRGASNLLFYAYVLNDGGPRALWQVFRGW